MLLSFYGDDFTGSTDVMEALTLGGVSTALFLRPPTLAQVEALEGVQAVGVAGRSRAMKTEDLRAHLRKVFTALAEMRSPLVHYKVCSTFDSSPQIGSIGAAIDVGIEVFDPAMVPLVIGAPVLGRYVAFANLFARSGLDSVPYRLDRHPTMSRHPVTPMDEADLRIHLSRQTSRAMAHIDLTRLDAGYEAVADALSRFGDDSPVVLFDTVTETHLTVIGRVLWEQASKDQSLFVVGSSGVEYALTRYWCESGVIGTAESRCAPEPVDRIAVVSGSLSPVTARQVRVAIEEDGFVGIAADTVALIDETRAVAEIDRCVSEAAAVLASGQSPIVHAGLGPDDPRVARVKAQMREGDTGALGAALGRVLLGIMDRTGVRRVAVTGGDTSGAVAEAMGVESLTFAGRLAPGSPLCTVRSRYAAVDGAQVVFKGGQVGWPGFFAGVREGAAREPLRT